MSRWGDVWNVLADLAAAGWAIFVIAVLPVLLVLWMLGVIR